MLVLSGDTSTPINTVALCEGKRILVETVVDCGRTHSERLQDTIAWVLAEAGISFSQLDLLAVSVGPGSFTGLRVGVAAWKGLAFAAKLPLVGVPTLDAMTHATPLLNGMLGVLLDAKMDEVFGAFYRYEHGGRAKCAEDKACSVETLLDDCSEDALFIGDGALRYKDRILSLRPNSVVVEGANAVPHASGVAMEALDLMAAGANTDATKVQPVYLRKSQAEIARDEARSR